MNRKDRSMNNPVFLNLLLLKLRSLDSVERIFLEYAYKKTPIDKIHCRKYYK